MDERQIEIRSDPKNIWNEAKSAIVLGINYGPESNPLNDLKKLKEGISQFILEEKIIIK